MKFLQKEEVSKTVTAKEYLEFEVFKKKKNIMLYQ